MQAASSMTASPVDLAGAARVQELQRPESKERMAKVARDFEGMLMEQLMAGLRKTVEPSGLFGEAGQSRSTYEYLMDQAVIAKAVQSGKGLGLASYMERIWESRSLGKSGPLPIG